MFGEPGRPDAGNCLELSVRDRNRTPALQSVKVAKKCGTQALPVWSCPQTNNFLLKKRLSEGASLRFLPASGLPKSLWIFAKWDFMGEIGKNINKMEIFRFFSVILERPIKA